jgi:hypothetical protein
MAASLDFMRFEIECGMWPQTSLFRNAIPWASGALSARHPGESVMEEAVTPAKAGVYHRCEHFGQIPAFAGMTR